jgi:deazaflavin-dependent oxidoreductase (nitroreductase family)
MEWLRRFNRVVTNRITLTFAGRRWFAVVHHQGRRSAKAYRTPVVAAPCDEGFVIPLTYGDHVDWCRNVLAAGGCRLMWRGVLHEMAGPEIVDAGGVREAFSPRVWRMLARAEVNRCLRLERRRDDS